MMFKSDLFRGRSTAKKFYGRGRRGGGSIDDPPSLVKVIVDRELSVSVEWKNTTT